LLALIHLPDFPQDQALNSAGVTCCAARSM